MSDTVTSDSTAEALVRECTALRHRLNSIEAVYDQYKSRDQFLSTASGIHGYKRQFLEQATADFWRAIKAAMEEEHD